jgi:hypothetical protein
LSLLWMLLIIPLQDEYDISSLKIIDSTISPAFSIEIIVDEELKDD